MKIKVLSIVVMVLLFCGVAHAQDTTATPGPAVAFDGSWVKVDSSGNLLISYDGTSWIPTQLGDISVEVREISLNGDKDLLTVVRKDGAVWTWSIEGYVNQIKIAPTPTLTPSCMARPQELDVNIRELPKTSSIIVGELNEEVLVMDMVYVGGDLWAQIDGGFVFSGVVVFSGDCTQLDNREDLDCIFQFGIPISIMIENSEFSYSKDFVELEIAVVHLPNPEGLYIYVYKEETDAQYQLGSYALKFGETPMCGDNWGK